VHSMVCAKLNGTPAISAAATSTITVVGSASEDSPSAAAGAIIEALPAADYELSPVHTKSPEAAGSYLVKVLQAASTQDTPTYLTNAVARRNAIERSTSEHLEDCTTSELLHVQLDAEAQPPEQQGTYSAAEEPSISPAEQQANAIDAAKLALARAEAAEALAFQTPTQSPEPLHRGAPASFLQLWWHVTGDGRGRSSLEWLDKCFTATPNQPLDVRSKFFSSFATWIAAQASVLQAKGFNVPGWDAVEDATTSRLRNCHPHDYPHHLVEACTNLVKAQPQSLDSLLEAVLSQYNVYDNNSVLEAFRYMSMWVNAGATVKLVQHPQHPPRLPSHIDCDFLGRALKVLLTCDLFQITLRTIVFLYDHINLLSFDARGKIVSVILEECFYSLFLHWLSEVRLFFCNLLVYKLFRWSRFDVFREMQDMDHLTGLQLSVPTRLCKNRTNDSPDEENMQDFCLMAKLAFYLGPPLQHLSDPAAVIPQVKPKQLVYCKNAVDQLKQCIEESYEWGVYEFPRMLPKGVVKR